MKKYIKGLFLTIVVIGFFVVGKNVYAFDNDVSLNVNAFNAGFGVANLGTPFPTPGTWTTMTQNYVYGIRRSGVGGNGYVRAVQGSVTANYEPSRNYTIEVALKHANYLYSGDTPNSQGKIYNPYCDLQVSSGAVSNVNCTLEQNTYISGDTYYDRLSIRFRTSNNTYSNVVYTFQYGQLNQSDYIYINLNSFSGDEWENNWLSWDNIYMGYDDYSEIGGIISSLDRNNSTQQQTNGILGQIREKLSQFKDSFENMMSPISSKLQDIKESIGQGIGGLVQDIKNGVNGVLQFISSNVLGLDDIDDTLQDFIDDFDDNQMLSEMHSFLETPISMLEYIKNPSINPCVDKSFTIFNKQVTIPSGCFFWERQDVQTFREFWNILIGGAIVVSLGLKYFKIIHNAADPYKDDFLGGLDV